ncbi:MAG: aa3-type cytochrome c oxidase subunit IV [Novosphingobium sp.]
MSSGHDMKSANATYGGFLTLLKVGIVVCILVTALVIALIV